MHLTSIVDHLTAATPPTSITIGDANGVIQMVSTALIIILAVIFVTSSIFICFHRSLSDGCCGVNGDRDDDFAHYDDGDGRRRRMPGLSRAVIETLPTYLYSDVKAHRLGNGELECAVCLNEFKDVEILRLLPNCCHVFHPDCIDTWLKSRATCPVCRADVGSMSNLTEHGELRMFGFSNEEDHSYDIEQVPVQVITPEPVQITRFQGNKPRAHSTGHSPAWTAQESDRFTLRLPEEVRNKLAASGRWRHGGAMVFMSSPKSWYRPRSVVGWCSRSNRKQYFHRFNTQDRMDRFGEPVASSNVVVSCCGSPKSDGPVDYSTLVSV